MTQMTTDRARNSYPEEKPRNRIRCKKCLDVIESVHQHDFKRCQCGAIFVDGGTNYQRFGWPDGDWHDWIEQI